MADSSPTKPSCIRGGCLCGDVRYEIDLENASWPPKVSPQWFVADCKADTLGALATHLLLYGLQEECWESHRPLARSCF